MARIAPNRYARGMGRTLLTLGFVICAGCATSDGATPAATPDTDAGSPPLDTPSPDAAVSPQDSGAAPDGGPADTGAPAPDAPLAADTGPAPDPGPADDAGPAADVVEPKAAPTFPHFDMLVDAFREDVNVWAYLAWLDPSAEAPEPIEVGYADTADRADFWPASTIKVYSATAALVLLKAGGFTLDATATFYHHDGEEWVEDISKTIRQLVFETFNCSSNSAYTLLLRFAGVDWLNTEVLVAERGFDRSALMVGYVDERPWAYYRSEPQRIVLTEGDATLERTHEYSGLSYSDAVDCTVGNADHIANCTSPHDLAEHLRRLMFHEQLPPDERFDLDLEALDWMRYGGPEPVMNNAESCGGPGWAGVSAVLPGADFYHKGGSVSSYRLDAQYVEDEATGTRYFLAVATDTGSSWLVQKLSEEVARMAVLPYAYVRLENLLDHVNPVVADLTVYSDAGGTLELVVKPWEADPADPGGWSPLPGASAEVPPGVSEHTLVSGCQELSEKLRIRGRLTTPDGVATSDLHYVIVDASVDCP